MLLGMVSMYLILGLWFTLIGISNGYFKPTFIRIIVMIIFYPVILIEVIERN